MTRKEFAESIMIGHNIGNALECIEPYRYNNTVKSFNVEREVNDINGYHDFRISVQLDDDKYELHYSYEEIWSNTPITTEYLAKLKSFGIQAVRLPFNLIGHIIDPTNHTVDPLWLKRIREVVEMCIDNGLKCILNMHTDYAAACKTPSLLSIIDTTRDPYTDTMGRLMSVWAQLTEYLNDISVEDLAFELTNEFQLTDIENRTDADTLASYASNLYRYLFTSIRNVGGNAAERFLLIGGYRNDIWYSISTFIDLINTELDDKCLLTTCYYTPWQFTVGDRVEWEYSGDTKVEMDKHYQYILDTINSTEIPFVITEYGAGLPSKNHFDSVNYTYHNMKWAYDNSIPAFVWDPGYILHRNTLEYGIPFWEDMVRSVINGTDYDITSAYDTYKDSITFDRCTEQTLLTYMDISQLDNPANIKKYASQF